MLYVQGPQPDRGLLAFDISDPTAPTVLGHVLQLVRPRHLGRACSRPRASAALRGRPDPCDIVVNWAGDSIRVSTGPTRRTDHLSKLVLSPSSATRTRAGSPATAAPLLHGRARRAQHGANTSVRVLDAPTGRTPSPPATGSGRTSRHRAQRLRERRQVLHVHYERGLTILDVTDPSPRPSRPSSTPTRPPTRPLQRSLGRLPVPAERHILVCNIDGAGGLFVLRQQSPTSPVSRPPRAPPSPPAHAAPRRVDGGGCSVNPPLVFPGPT